MNINNARKILTEMQGCFQESNHPAIKEKEVLNQSDGFNYLQFCSWLTKDDKVAEIVVYLSVDQDLVRLSMYLHGGHEEIVSPELFILINNINDSDPSHYWIIHPDSNKLEFRTAYIISESQFNKDQFKSVLKGFLEQGPSYYTSIKYLM